MPYDYSDPKVGDLVYRNFRPQQAGKIVEVLGPTSPSGSFHHVKVRWMKGTETIEDSGHLKCLPSLIADHEKKLKTHQNTLAKVKHL